MEEIKKHPGGQPPLYTPERVEEIKELFCKYISDNEIPIIAEFAYTNELSRQSLYDYEEFSTLRRRCIDKKESNLERGGLAGKLNSSMSIFSLKQLGWRDRQDMAISADGLLGKFLTETKSLKPIEEPKQPE